MMFVTDIYGEDGEVTTVPPKGFLEQIRRNRRRLRMTEMEKQELKHKLAEWAGFRQRLFEFSTYWHYPEHAGGKVCGWEPPNFTSSLDSCFKWLVPELRKRGIHLKLSDMGDGYLAVLKDMGSAKQKPESLPRVDLDIPILGIADAKEGAIAVCKAIEKMIDKEVLDGN